MKNILIIKIVFLNIVICIFLLLSCGSMGTVKSIDCSVGENIDISEQELDEFSRKFEVDPTGNLQVVVTIFRYSRGSEILSYSGDDSINSTRKMGEIEALVQIIEGDRIKAIKFIKVFGMQKKLLFANLTREVNKILNN